MNNSKIRESLLDLLEEEVLSLTAEDLMDELGTESLIHTEVYVNGKEMIQATLDAQRPHPLEAARKAYEEHVAQRANIQMTLDEARQYLFELMSGDKLPKGLTVAFREGKEIPDEELIDIAIELRRLVDEGDDV